MGRLVRPGQTRAVTVWYLLAEHTLDTAIYRVHARKRTQWDACLPERPLVADILDELDADENEADDPADADPRRLGW